ncbi:hypothetical protein HY418_00440 [Candidatus Kaiserbacteria bacterium]|nr:hypothetical protein [Candidatus Kaiserbacteria bacterium]
MTLLEPLPATAPIVGLIIALLEIDSHVILVLSPSLMVLGVAVMVQWYPLGPPPPEPPPPPELPSELT